MPNRFSRYADGVMEACWLLALILTPLFFNIYSSRVFEPDKIALMRSLALVALAAWLIKLIGEGGPRFEPARANYASPTQFLRIPLLAPVAALVVVYLISTIFSVAPQATIYGSYQRLQGTFTTFSYLVLFAVVAANLRRRSQAERMITTVIVTSLPIAIYGILQHNHLDPLPWGGDTSTRVTGNMGNAIFIAAYLIMSALAALGRVVMSFHAILTDEDQRVPISHVVRAALYILILAVNLVSIWWSGSRGPWLGLGAGIILFGLLLSLHWRVPALTLAAIVLFIAGGAFLVVLNIPGGPLERVREIPGVGRLGEVFETEGGSGRVRVLIWHGVIDLMAPHEPLRYPDGSVDRWNALRPLIGYGPESLYVAFNRFYPPELAQWEARNASPDRSHNETFDALAFTGTIGLVVYLGLFTAVFYYAFKWLGIVTTPRRRWLFLSLVLGGGLIGAGVMMVWQGPEFFGVGLPFGMLIGVIVFMMIYAAWSLWRVDLEPAKLDAAAAAPTMPETWRAVMIISLISAIAAHFTEIHFGIAIVSSRTHFWLFTALMLVVGFVMSSRPAAAEPVGGAPPGRSRRRTRAAPTRHIAAGDNRTVREEWAPVLIGGLILGAILVTLGFDFITNAGRSDQPARIVVDALTIMPDRPEIRSYGVLLLFALTWLVGGGLAVYEEAPRARSRTGVIGAGLGLALLVGLIGWIMISSHLASMANIEPQDIGQLIQSANRLARILTLFYLQVALVLAGLGGALMLDSGVAGRVAARLRGGSMSPLAILSSALLLIMAVFGSVFFNAQPIQADIIYKTGLQFDDSGQPIAAIELYKRALELAPAEDYYYLFLGRSYLNATGSPDVDTNTRDGLLRTAEDQLKAARTLNPLNTDHTANLARLNRRWAELAAEPAARDEHVVASNDYYTAAVELSPNNAGLWNEWAALALQVMQDPITAQTYLTHSFTLDAKFDQTYQLQGDLYAFQARQATDPAVQQSLYDQAVTQYLRSIQVAEDRLTSPASARVNLASTYAAAGQPAAAIEQYQWLLNSGDTSLSRWQVYLAISELYAQLGDMAQARANAEQALQAAPDSDKPSVQQWLARLP